MNEHQDESSFLKNIEQERRDFEGKMENEQRAHALREARRWRQRIVLILVPGLIGIAFWFVQYIPSLAISDDRIFKFASLGLIFMSAISLVMFYLQTGFERVVSYRVNKSFNHDLGKYSGLDLNAGHEDLHAKLNQLQTKIVNIETIQSIAGNNSAEQTKRLVSELRDQILSEGSSQVLTSIREQVASSSKRDAGIHALNQRYSETLRRLEAELARLNRGGNLSLTLGLAITIAGLIVLATFVFGHNAIVSGSEITTLGFLVNYLPRLSLVIFIELFAYFFLKLYKSGLAEIKYFQNEITNVESRHMALQAAFAQEHQETTAEVIKKLASIERNFVLKKGESTVDLERLKHDKELVSQVSEKFLDALTKIAKK